jgi:hypothetical protein
LKKQGSLEPVTQADVDARDKEKSPWIKDITQRILPLTSKSRCISAEELSGVIEKNLVYGTVLADKRKLMVNCLFLRSNVVIIPYHYFEVDTLDVTFRKVDPDSCGGKFVTRLSKSACMRIPETDLCICYSSSGGSFKDLTSWFPTDILPDHQFTLLWRSKEGTMTRASGLAHSQVTTNGVCNFLGGEYTNLSIKTFNGLCGAVVVSHGKGSCVSGIHLGGRDGTARGCYGSLTQDQITYAVDHLRLVEGVVISGTAENFEKQVLGVNILTGSVLHEKSPIRFLPEHSQLEYYGTCPGHSSSHSDVKVTPISVAVTEITGEPNIWGPPKMKPEWFGWQTCLSNLSIPAHPYTHDLLVIAVRDYKSSMIPLFQSPLWRSAKPLDTHANLCGIPGLKFVDAINLNTSIGFPLKGPKRKFVTELEPTLEHPNNRVLDQVILDEIDRCLDCYKRGERAYPVAKACKKDEILAKEKCRIFYGNPLPFTFLIRKYYLPILRVMEMNPLVSECAVGINSYGPEWQALHDHVLTFGKDRIIGGDYGKYDQKLPSQLIFASLRIMIDFARECDYSTEDLAVMEAMTGDLVFALIAFNGDLVGLTEGTHISGNSLTVVINGICGSLNLRAYFYSEYPPVSFEERKPFRDNVKLMTYGDDNIGSVSKAIDKFTIKGCSEFLDGYGQVYTMPDKESKLLDFLPYSDFEFLKRTSTYCPERGIHTGALNDKSCFKMLHCHIRGKGAQDTEEMASALNMDTALREWAHHGRDTYEMRRVQMTKVAALAGVTHLCTQLDVDYTESIQVWKEKYDTNYQLYDTVIEEPFELQ